MKKIMIFGTNGLLGHDLEQIFTPIGNILAPSSSELNFLRPGDLEKAVESYHPDIIINSAAMTNVDEAELSKEKALQINAYAVRELAKAAVTTGARLIHISTDYVFNGTAGKQYTEEDPRNAANFYGYTKVMAEEFLETSGTDFMIFRVAWLIGVKRPTLYDMIANYSGKELGIIDDQWGDPTFSSWAAAIIKEAVVSQIPSGIYNLTSSANITRYEFARYLKERLDLQFSLNPITSDKLERPALRPRATSLDNSKLAAALKRKLAPWKEQMERFICD